MLPYVPQNLLEEKLLEQVEEVLGLELKNNPFQAEDFCALARHIKVIKEEKSLDDQLLTYMPENFLAKPYIQKLLILACVANLKGKRFLFIIDEECNIIAKKVSSIKFDKVLAIVELLHQRLLEIEGFYKMIGKSEAIEESIENLVKVERHLGLQAIII